MNFRVILLLAVVLLLGLATLSHAEGKLRIRLVDNNDPDFNSSSLSGVNISLIHLVLQTVLASGTTNESGIEFTVPGGVPFYIVPEPDIFGTMERVNGTIYGPVPISALNFQLMDGVFYELRSEKSPIGADLDFELYKNFVMRGPVSCSNNHSSGAFQAGSVVETRPDATITLNEYCIGDRVVERYCPAADTFSRAFAYSCGVGNKCIDGACVQLNCADSDGGKDFYKKGVLDYLGTKIADSCGGTGNQLLENYCDQGGYGTSFVDCPGEYICSEGACVPNALGLATPLSANIEVRFVEQNPPSVLIYLKDVYGNVLQSEISGGKDHVHFTVQQGVPFYIDSPDGYADSSSADYGYQPEVFRLVRINGEDRLHFAHSEEYLLAPFQIQLKKKSARDLSCGDGDGLDYYTRLNINYQSDVRPGYNFFRDVCLDDKILMEEICKGSSPAFQAYECPEGCSEGACISSQSKKTLTLIFSWLYQADGSKDFSHMGTMSQGYAALEAKGDKHGFNFNNMIVCLGEDFYFRNDTGYGARLWANNGNGGLIDMGQMNLDDVAIVPESGYDRFGIPVVLGHVYAVKSKDGSHYGLIKPYILEVRDLTNDWGFCKDTEYGNDLVYNDIYKKGDVTVGYMNRETTLSDSCIDVNTVGEQICAGFAHTEPYKLSCPFGYSCSDGACVNLSSAPMPSNPTPQNPAWQSNPLAHSANIYLYPGWNMFSLPNSGTDRLTSTCSGFNESAIWMYYPFNKSYIRPHNLAVGDGYWFYARERCEIRSDGYAFSPGDMFLHAGWNLVGSTIHSVSFDAIKGTCDIVKGPYSYNSGSQAYESATLMSPGQAYFVKVREDCRFGVVPQPPSPPTEG